MSGASPDTAQTRAWRWTPGMGTVVPRGTDEEKPWSPGTAASSLLQQSRLMLIRVCESCSWADGHESSKCFPHRLSVTHGHCHHLGRQTAPMLGFDTQLWQPMLGMMSCFPSPLVMPTGCSLTEQSLSLPFLSRLGGCAARCTARSWVPWRASQLLLSHLSGSLALCKRRESLLPRPAPRSSLPCSARLGSA